MPFEASAPAESEDVGSIFLKAAERLKDRPAIIQGKETTTFGELAAEVDELSRGYTRVGLFRSARAAVLIPPSRAFFATAFALFRAGAVPVLIDPGIGFKNLGGCLKEAAPDAFIGSPKAHAARVLGRWAKTAKILFSTGWFPGVPSVDGLRVLGRGRELPPQNLSAGERAAILFTSGSTGAPKGAVYLHSTFAAQIALLREMFGIKEGDVSLATFPLFAVFDLALGQTVILPDMDFTRPGFVDPAKIVGPAQAHKAVQLFGSPALLERVGRYGERHGIALPDLKRVMSAGAPVPAKTMARFSKMLEPGTPIHTPYGATEALPVALTDSRELLGETAKLTAEGKGTCVGRPVRGLQVAIIKIDDAPIRVWSEDLRAPRGVVGEICVKGPQVTGEYYRRLDDMAKAKIGDGKEFWHRMGDLGYLDDQGRLWFCGRKAHRVGDLYTECVEGFFNEVDGIRRTALVGVNGNPVLCVEPEEGTDNGELLKRVESRAGTAYPWAKGRSILFKDQFPVDIRHNAKIFREKLAVWAQEKLK